MSLSATPRASSSSRQALARVLVTSWLKRACTMPMTRSLPARRSAWPLSAPNIGILLVMGRPRRVAGDLEAVAGHAGHAPRRTHEDHPLHAALAQDLRAHPVGAQVHAAALRRLRGARGAFELRQQLLRALAAIEQHRHAMAHLRDVLEARLQAPGVHG